jgi:Mrp family chromosome partitioning ATPase
VRCEQEIGDLFGISCIGLVPQIARRRLSRLSQYLLANPFSAYAEAIRSAAAMLRLAEGGESARVVLVSSSIPGEGKTVLARSLATFAGSLGRRVLLVDLDFRRGTPPDGFGEAGERAIIHRPLQNRSPAELVRPIAEGRYDYLPMPGRRDDPLTLFAPEQIGDLIRQLRGRYDCLIVDGPPVLEAVEARLLASIADELVLVVKWGSTRREVIANALSLLRDCGGPGRNRSDLPLAVLTQVDLKQHARYRHGDVAEFLAADGKRRFRTIAPRRRLAAAAAALAATQSRLATLSTLLRSSRRPK